MEVGIVFLNNGTPILWPILWPWDPRLLALSTVLWVIKILEC